MQNYKSLHAAVMICSTLVNIHTHIHRDSIWHWQACLMS